MLPAAAATRPARAVPVLRLAWLALVLLTLVRLLVAASTPLAPDEAYYWTWSHALAPGYLDHPPMTALWIRAGCLLAGDTPLGIRLLGPLAAALGSVLVVDACADLAAPAGGTTRPAGLAAAALLNATLLLGVGAVTMTPDTPLMACWTLALWCLARLLRSGRGVWWLATGAAIGLAMDSKYTALLPAAGVGAWLLVTRAGRRWAVTPWPWLGALISALVFAPVILWNARHGWASFAKQGGRTGAWHPADALRYLGELVGGQAGLATPLIFCLFVAGIWRLCRRPLRGQPGPALLCWVTLLPLAVFVQHALGDRVQANWPSPLYPACAMAAATLGWRWKPAAGLGLAITGLVYAQAVDAPLRLPRHLDVTLVRLAGWPALARVVGGWPEARRGFIVADEYGLAAELAFYLPGRTVLAAEPRWRLFALPHPALAGRTGLLLRDARRHDAIDPKLFARVVPLGEIARERDGEVARFYRLYRVTIRSPLPSRLATEIAALPRPYR